MSTTSETQTQGEAKTPSQTKSQVPDSCQHKYETQQPKPKSLTQGQTKKSNPNKTSKAYRKPSSRSAGTTARVVAKSAELTSKTVLEVKEKIFEACKTILGTKTASELNKVLGALGKGKDALAVVKKLSDLVADYQQGKVGGPVAFTGKMVSTLGNVYGLLPQKATRSLMRMMTKMLRQPGFRPLRAWSRVLRSLDKIGAMPETLQAIGGLLQGNGTEFANQIKGIGKKMKAPENRSKSVWLLKNFGKALYYTLPPSTRRGFQRRLIKAGGRKVPIVGTAIVGAMDVYNVASSGVRYLWSRFKGNKKAAAQQLQQVKSAGVDLGSTLVGLVPIVGTTGSTLIDLGKMIYEVSQISDEIAKQFKEKA